MVESHVGGISCFTEGSEPERLRGRRLHISGRRHPGPASFRHISPLLLPSYHHRLLQTTGRSGLETARTMEKRHGSPTTAGLGLLQNTRTGDPWAGQPKYSKGITATISIIILICAIASLHSRWQRLGPRLHRGGTGPDGPGLEQKSRGI